MTLLLAAVVADAVILAADSRVTGSDPSAGFCIGKKLFKCGNVGIATTTFEQKAKALESIPTIIERDFRPDLSVQEVCCLMQLRLKGDSGIGALITGFEEDVPVVYEVRVPTGWGKRLPDATGGTSSIVTFGGTFPLATSPSTINSVVAEMLAQFHANVGPTIGPPYDFLVIERGS